jgi:hypothetical protein
MLRRHLGHHEAGVLERPDRLAERLTLLHVGERQVERGDRAGDRGHRDGEPLLRQRLHQLAEAGPLLAEEVLRRDDDVLEDELGGVLRVHADLLELAAAAEAGHVALDDEQADAGMLRGRVGLRDDDDTSEWMPFVMNVFVPLSR